MSEPYRPSDSDQSEEDKERLFREKTVLRMLRYSFAPYILIIAMQQSIAIYGMQVVFKSHDFMEMVPFAGTALFLLLTMAGVLNRVGKRSVEIVSHPRFLEDTQ